MTGAYELPLVRVTSDWHGTNPIEMGLHSLRIDPRPRLISKSNSPISKPSTGQEVVYGAAGDFGPLTLLAS